MPEQQSAPFDGFHFTLIEGKAPRAALHMTAQDDGAFELHVQKGSAANPLMQFTRKVPLEVAVRFRDALQAIGVFGWEEAYGDETAPGSRRWSVSTVFKRDVFSVESRGGSDVPSGFDALLEELYRLDFPRPANHAKQGGASGGMSAGRPFGQGAGSALNALGIGAMGSVGSMSAGDMGAYAAAGRGGLGDVDFAKLAELMGSFGGMGGSMADALSNPQALQRRLKDEFHHMTREEQDQLIDLLVSSGMGTREFWQRFFRG